MDKYEYKVRADEIKALISEGEFAEAVSIADTIDWRRVKSVMMLCTISDLYKINRRYQESKDILLLAYEKHPTGRLIVYSLCELSIKMEEYVQAIEYYKEFVQIAPKDTGRYVLQYRLYEAQDVSLEERIAVLEEFKKRDYREKWAYELAYLYHRIGLTTKCVDECDEMFLWFGEGKYVIKALELKALHVPLSEAQQAKYDAWVRAREAGEEYPEETVAEESEEPDDVVSVPCDTKVAGQVRHAEEDLEGGQEVPAVPTMELPEVKPVDMGQYNTINLQMIVQEGVNEILADDMPQEMPEEPQETPRYDEVYFKEDEPLSESTETIEDEEEDIEETDTDLAAEPAESDEEEEENEEESLAVSLIAPLLEETAKMPAPEEVEEQIQEEDAPVRETAIVQFPEQTVSKAAEYEAEEEPVDSEAEQPVYDTPGSLKRMNTEDMQEIGAQIAKEDTASFDAQQIVEQMKQEAEQAIAATGEILTPLNAQSSKYDSFLSQEYDGQISLVVPEAAHVEKQITGQLSIDDIMAEWEEMKRTSQERRMEEVRQRILAHTGNLFADFDEATKNGLLEELERAFVAAIMKDSDKKPAIKKVVLPDDDETINSALDIVKSEAEQLAANITAKIELEETDVDDGVEELEEIEEIAAGETAEEEEITVKPAVKAASVEEEENVQENMHDRELTAEEQELFGQFAHHRKTRKQLVHALDNMSLASCTGNVIITGEEELTTLTLAKALIKEMQYNDNNFSEKVAKISANVLNKKDVAETFARLDNGVLIIEKASRLKPLTISKMTKVLEKDNMGLLLIIIDKKQNINQLFAEHTVLNNNFNLRIDIEPLNDEALVAYAKQYAEEMEYSIDEFGILALHTRIADRQTSDHEVSMAEVRELVDEAIHYANKKTPKHFMDILLAKRYDEEDMIILREKDFMHY